MIDVLRILLPTDFSEASREAAKYAFSLADRYGAELHVLHVIEEIAPSLPEAVCRVGTDPEHFLTQARETAEKHLAAALPNDIAGGKNVVRAVREGSPPVQILDYAREHGVDLIVIGTHGRGGFTHFLIGSVAERIVRHAECPVLTIRAAAGRQRAP